MDKPIAKLKLIEVSSDGTRTPISVEVGCPYLNARGSWTCTALIDGLDNKPRDSYGEDSLQSLILGLRLVRVHLEGVLERGSRLVYADCESEFPIDAYFWRGLMITENSIVVLNHDRTADGLHAGDVGRVVHAYAGSGAYEVKFVDGEGTTIALLTLEAHEVRPMEAGELLHTRRREM